MKRCELCSQPFPSKIEVEGRLRSLQNRKYCLSCSPFKAHNTRRWSEPWSEEMSRRLNAVSQRKKFCRYQRKKRRQRKRLLVELLGGRCLICGYNKDCSAAYSFHHRDPARKSFEFGSRGLLRRGDELIVEVNKCVLLCCRCHAEVHAGLHTEWEFRWGGQVAQSGRAAD